MSKSDTWENGLLDLLFDNLDFTLVGDAGGLRGSVADGSLYFSLHSADPGEAGTQLTSEAAYTGYARVAVGRAAGFTVTGDSVSPAAAVTFPPGTAGGETVTHFGVGTDSSGAGKLLYSGTVTPNIVTGDGITPELTTATAITED